MKQLVKNLFLALALTGLFVACDDDKEEPIVYGEAKMLSFGFYEEDNEGVLFRDYIIENVASTTIRIDLPGDADKSKLIARFTVSEDDVVSINGVEQLSGVNVNNFTIPVDYLVTEGTNNTRYTVTIGKLPDAVWSSLAVSHIDVSTASMAVNPNTGEPYVAYVKSGASTSDYRLGAMKYTTDGWQSLGAEAGISSGRPGDYCITFDETGKPYIVFGDYTSSPAQRATVASYSNSTWSVLGNNITAGLAAYASISVVNGNPIVFSMNNTNGSSDRRFLVYNTYTGSSWSSDTRIPGRPAVSGSAYASYNVRSKVYDNTVYVVVTNINQPGIFSVYTYKNGNWTTIYEGGETPLDEDSTSPHTYDLAFDIDREGNIYVAYSNGNPYFVRVKKYTASTKTWRTVGGGSLDVIDGNARYYDIAVSPYGIPFVIYRNNSKYPVIVALDSESQQWDTPIVLENVEAENLWIDFAEDGTGYLIYTRDAAESTTNIVLYKYDIP